jgi:hypothetical protein
MQSPCALADECRCVSMHMQAASLLTTCFSRALVQACTASAWCGGHSQQQQQQQPQQLQTQVSSLSASHVGIGIASVSNSQGSVQVPTLAASQQQASTRSQGSQSPGPSGTGHTVVILDRSNPLCSGSHRSQ